MVSRRANLLLTANEAVGVSCASEGTRVCSPNQSIAKIDGVHDANNYEFNVLDHSMRPGSNHRFSRDGDGMQKIRERIKFFYIYINF